MVEALNVWNLNWLLYLLGFLFLPRINLLFIWYFHGGSLWSYPWVLYVSGWFLMPRMFTGLLVAFTTQNYSLGVFLTLAGFVIDGGTKYGFSRHRRRRRDRR